MAAVSVVDFLAVLPFAGMSPDGNQDISRMVRQTVLGMIQMATAFQKEAQAADRLYQPAFSNLVSLDIEAGRIAEAEKLCREAITLPPEYVLVSSCIGDSYPTCKDSEAARDPALAHIKSGDDLASLRAGPRWNALMQKIGLPTD